MGIETDFSFAHEQALGAGPDAAALAHPPDLLGLLRPFVGPLNPRQNAKRSWVGTGFNLIWRPNAKQEFGPKDFFLQLNLTTEQLDFTEITGTGIANRSLSETGIKLGGAAYTQSIKDSFDETGQHFEPGVWANVPKITSPNEPASVVRMGSIPHGSTINLQGIAFDIGNQPPQFSKASITPFGIGNPDDGATGLSTALSDEEDLGTDTKSRTDKKRLGGLTAAQLRDPNLFLSGMIPPNQKFKKTTVLILSSQAPDPPIPPPPPVAPPRPDSGGGTANIAFLTGTSEPPSLVPLPPPAGGFPNANAFVPKVTTTFWIEELDDAANTLQLQYTQRVLLNFNGLSWPHITVATLRLSHPTRP